MGKTIPCGVELMDPEDIKAFASGERKDYEALIKYTYFTGMIIGLMPEFIFNRVSGIAVKAYESEPIIVNIKSAEAAPKPEKE